MGFRPFAPLRTLFLAGLLVGCAPNAAYHTLSGQPGNCVDAAREDACTQSYYQEHGGYDLAFAEFTERGNAFSDRYVDEVLSRIGEKAQGDGIVLVVFIHGWKHNAEETDGNLIDFKASLQAVGRQLTERFAASDLGKRHLVGLYVGWRGASIQAPLLIQTTFWDRKAVAEEVGKGGVTRLLLELDEITGRRAENVMVVIGHSFGGAIVVSGLSEVLTERAVHRTRGRGYARTLGDGVLVLNPAIEANQLLNFVEASLRQDYRPEQHPLFISLSSDADSATHYAFPLGQTVGLLATWRQADLKRSYLYDRLHSEETLVLREEHLDATTVGNFAPFLTHRLTAAEQDGNVSFRFKTCDQNPEGCEPAGLTTLSGQPAIRALPKHYPLYFVKTDASLVTGHNDIFNDRVGAFVVAVIDDVVLRSLARVRAAKRKEPEVLPESILNNPERLQQRMQTLLLQMRRAAQ